MKVDVWLNSSFSETLGWRPYSCSKWNSLFLACFTDPVGHLCPGGCLAFICSAASEDASLMNHSYRTCKLLGHFLLCGDHLPPAHLQRVAAVRQWVAPVEGMLVSPSPSTFALSHPSLFGSAVSLHVLLLFHQLQMSAMLIPSSTWLYLCPRRAEAQNGQRKLLAWVTSGCFTLGD
jgi:hypothetical protein